MQYLYNGYKALQEENKSKENRKKNQRVKKLSMLSELGCKFTYCISFIE